jgi:hypothetical protein
VVCGISYLNQRYHLKGDRESPALLKQHGGPGAGVNFRLCASIRGLPLIIVPHPLAGSHLPHPTFVCAGCINDARCMKYLLTTKLGFKEEQVLMLTGTRLGTPAAVFGDCFFLHIVQTTNQGSCVVSGRDHNVAHHKFEQFSKGSSCLPTILAPPALAQTACPRPPPPWWPPAALLDPWLAAAACAEEDRDPLRIPTRYNIMSALYWLIQGQQPGDSLVFHYSGKRPALGWPRPGVSLMGCASPGHWLSEPKTRLSCQGPNAYRHLALTVDVLAFCNPHVGQIACDCLTPACLLSPAGHGGQQANRSGEEVGHKAWVGKEGPCQRVSLISRLKNSVFLQVASFSHTPFEPRPVPCSRPRVLPGFSAPPLSTQVGPCLLRQAVIRVSCSLATCSL